MNGIVIFLIMIIAVYGIALGFLFLGWFFWSRPRPKYKYDNEIWYLIEPIQSDDPNFLAQYDENGWVKKKLYPDISNKDKIEPLDEKYRSFHYCIDVIGNNPLVWNYETRTYEPEETLKKKEPKKK